MARKYDIIIVGGGPAGIFVALELSQASDLKMLLIEKGRDIDRRLCPVRDTMFAAGDGAGVSRGLIQASASGVVVAGEILRRCRYG